MTVVVAGGNAYLRADAYSLVNYLGFKVAGAARYANTWLLIPRTDRDYPTVASDVTLSSIIDDELNLPAPLSSVPTTTVDGERALGVSARAQVSGHTVTDTVYARATGLPLPIESVASAGNNRTTATFNDWNEPLHVSIPAGAVAIAATGLE